MKKIVALVLAMVMVLGLATTAMAATAVNQWDLEVYLDGPNTGDNDSSAFAAELKVVTAAKDDEYAVYEVIMTAKKNGVVWEGKEYDKGEDFTLEVNSADEFVIVASPVNADFAVVDGKTTTWLAAAEDFNDAGWDEKASMIQLEWVENPNKWDCNAIYAIGPNNTILFMYEGVLFVETTLAGGCDYLFNVGGIAVPANEAVDGTDYYFNPHTYAATYKWGVNGADVEEVYCLCNGVKTTFDFAVDNVGSVFNARKAFGDDYQYALLIEVASGTDLIPAADVYVEKVAPTNFKVLVGAGVTGAATGTAPEAGETVTSPKTFDAGIAMYVGMSVMAAAGSAVVLKKKD